jgi:hypothetical protein
LDPTTSIPRQCIPASQQTQAQLSSRQPHVRSAGTMRGRPSVNIPCLRLDNYPQEEAKTHPTKHPTSKSWKMNHASHNERAFTSLAWPALLLTFSSLRLLASMFSHVSQTRPPSRSHGASQPESVDLKNWTLFLEGGVLENKAWEKVGSVRFVLLLRFT